MLLFPYANFPDAISDVMFGWLQDFGQALAIINIQKSFQLSFMAHTKCPGSQDFQTAVDNRSPLSLILNTATYIVYI